MRSVYQLLDTSEQLLRSGWVQHCEAVDKDNNSVAPWSDLATRYCVLGSVRAVTYYEVPAQEARYTKFIMSIINMANTGVMKYERIESRNDQTEQAVAISMVNRAKQYVLNHFGPDYVPNWLKGVTIGS